MKKIRFVLLAALLAIGLSSYSSATAKPVGQYFWYDTSWHVIVLSNPPCPEGYFNFCYYNVGFGYGIQQMYYSGNFWDPVRKPQ